MIKQIKKRFERNKYKLDEISNRQLAKRWHCDNGNIGRWDAADSVKLKVLRAGVAVNLNKSLPVPQILELEAYCAERGMVIQDLVRVSSYSITSIRRWIAEPRYHTRFWDLLNGCVVML